MENNLYNEEELNENLIEETEDESETVNQYGDDL